MAEYLQKGGRLVLFPEGRLSRTGSLMKLFDGTGFLIYKTYTIEQQRFSGGPSHPKFLLKPNELLQVFNSLRILHYHETVQEKGIAELVAQKV